MTPTKFLLSWKGQQTGPFSVDEIRSKLAAGEVSLMHQVKADGRWLSVDEFLGKTGEQTQRERLELDRRQQAERNATHQALLQAQQEELRQQHEQEVVEERVKQVELQNRLAEVEKQMSRQREFVSSSPALSGNPLPAVYSQQGFFQPRRTSGLAIAALIMAILNFVPGLNVISWILALIFGHVALSNMKHDTGLEGRGMAITSLVITYALLGIAFAWGILVLIGITRLPKY